MKQLFFSMFIFLLPLTIWCQQTAWYGKQCAVVLTYDDAYDEQLNNAVPVLDSLGLKASFYVTAFSKSIQTRMQDWKELAAKGHELGNHTLFHPCVANMPGRQWVPSDYQLDRYTVKRMLDEIRMTNLFLQALDGKTKRTFAYTCADMKISDTSFIDSLQNDFIAARSVRNEMHALKDVKLYDVDCYLVNNHNAQEMIGWVNKAVQSNSLLVILFHGVGGGNGLDVTTEAHRQLLIYLQKNQEKIWIAPMIEVADYINSLRPKK